MLKTIVASILLALSGAAANAADVGETITYTYDAQGHLTKVQHSGTVNNGQVTVYNYDAADNRTSVTTTGASH